MYEAHFHLPRRPFLASADESRFFNPEPIQQLIRELVVPLESGLGIVILTGPFGVGKTAICRQIAADLGRRCRAVHFTFDTARTLQESIGSERGAAVIVDDAHLLNAEQLDELWQFGSPLAGDQRQGRVMLVGQSALDERLTDPALEKLSASIISHLYVEPWSERQSIDYVKSQIEWAGGRSSQIFTPRALERIALVCNGLPVCLNSLCDHVLLLAFAQEQTWVTEEAVEDALIDVQHLPLPWNLPAAGQFVN